MLLDTPVLLCLDLQMEFIAPGRPFADPDGDEIAARCAALIDEARQAGWSVVHTQLHQGGPLIASGHGLTQPIPGCEPRPGEVLLRRAGVSAFAHPDLEGVLEASAGTGAYVIGFSAPLSLTSTLFDAEDRRQALTVVDGAIGGADVSEWSAEESRALLVHTAERLNRSITLAELHERLRTPVVAAPALAVI
jgi:nicotinamidase-related amidase